ncbi:MAG: hypothetical protein AABX33_02520 [Nanoarchaeota archaeon]
MPTASELERGNYFIYNNEPVRVLRKELVAYGTHSHSKLKIFFQGLQDRGERTITLRHEDKVELIDIVKKLGQIISKVNNRMQIMDMTSYETHDAIASGDLLNELNEGDQVTFIELKGNIQILEKR